MRVAPRPRGVAPRTPRGPSRSSGSVRAGLSRHGLRSRRVRRRRRPQPAARAACPARELGGASPWRPSESRPASRRRRSPWRRRSARGRRPSPVRRGRARSCRPGCGPDPCRGRLAHQRSLPRDPFCGQSRTCVGWRVGNALRVEDVRSRSRTCTLPPRARHSLDTERARAHIARQCGGGDETSSHDGGINSRSEITDHLRGERASAHGAICHGVGDRVQIGRAVCDRATYSKRARSTNAQPRAARAPWTCARPPARRSASRLRRYSVSPATVHRPHGRDTRWRRLRSGRTAGHRPGAPTPAAPRESPRARARAPLTCRQTPA